jgi:hypothetical protein
MTRTILSALALGIACSAVSPAQAPVSLNAGSRIRIRTQDSTRILILVGFSTDSVVVRHAADAPLETLPLSQIRRLEVSAGKRTPGQGMRRGLGLGLLIGGGTGIVLGLADGDDDPGIVSFTAGEKAMMGGLFLGGLGGIAGLITGGTYPGEQWQRASTTGARLSVVPQSSGGLALTVSRAW